MKISNLFLNDPRHIGIPSDRIKREHGLTLEQFNILLETGALLFAGYGEFGDTYIFAQNDISREKMKADVNCGQCSGYGTDLQGNGACEYCYLDVAQQTKINITH